MDRIASLVVDAIDALEKRRSETALMNACIALDATARRRLGRNTSSKLAYKELVRDYVWCLHMMLGGGIDLARTRFTNVQIHDGKKIITDPDIADILYHIYRCNLAHGKSLPPDFALQNAEDATFVLADGVLNLPERIIWGVLAISVFAKTNADLQCGEDYFLSWSSGRANNPQYLFMIDQNWGKEDLAKEILLRHPPQSVVEIRW